MNSTVGTMLIGWMLDPQLFFESAMQTGNNHCIVCGILIKSLQECGGLIRKAYDDDWKNVLVCREDDCCAETRSGRYAD